MKAPIPWRCFACDAANAASATVCAACGFPSQANAQQIEAARAVRDGVPASGYVKPEPFIKTAREVLAPLPPWRQLMLVLGGLLFGGGVIGLKIVFSVQGLLQSLPMGGAGLVLMMIGAPKDSKQGDAE